MAGPRTSGEHGLAGLVGRNRKASEPLLENRTVKNLRHGPQLALFRVVAYDLITFALLLRSADRPRQVTLCFPIVSGQRRYQHASSIYDTHVLRYESTEALHGLCNAFLIGRNDLAEVFRVHARR